MTRQIFPLPLGPSICYGSYFQAWSWNNWGTFSSLHWLGEHENPELCVCACLKEKALLGLHILIPSMPSTALLGESGEGVFAMPFSPQYLLSFGLQHLQVIRRRDFQDFAGGRQAPVVSMCFYKNGFLTYLSFFFFWTKEWKMEESDS